MKLGSFALEEPDEINEESKEESGSKGKEEEDEDLDEEEGEGDVVFYDKDLYAAEEGLTLEEIDFD
eukprot:CAMPEP_0170556098 /NCGR_PEP_ID=MMETSP0211-20121228/15687_1 /TAXON_ID=311385 /ORGANISM="Pseudokeronopsis sp., Strain OXSARD2" /LENGTH=65 /DNA_ID=CAMNT_0010866233 /DNA_START=560 /DNA_END=757 /DNA_ORIENTATION=+